jgi:transposase
VLETARLIHRHNVMTFLAHRTTNALTEGLDSKIIKKMVCRFRNRQHFKTASYFNCGGLDLYPAAHGIPR